MEVFIGFLILFFVLSAIWFLITGIIVVFTGRDISIGDLFARIRSAQQYSRSREEIETVLLSRFRYYSTLPPEHQTRFLKRVSGFLENKEFSVDEGQVLNPEHKILVAASAVQLTFGLDKYLLDHFSRIILYPKEYFSSLNQNYHKGEVNIRGAIVLSMEDFFFGIENSTDGYNLGLHEMSHALHLELMLRGDYDAFFGNYFVKWQQEAETEMQKMQSTENPVLREYASTNMAEFFAVCVENFFERPAEFKEKMPELYHRMTLLLNQDPADKTGFIRFPREKINTDSLVRLDPGVVQFQTAVPWKDILQETGLGFFLWIFPALAIPEPSLLIQYSIVILLLLIFRLFPQNRIAVCEKALVVKSVLNFWSDGKLFLYPNIVMIALREEGVGDFEILHISGTHIRSKRYAWPSGNTDTAEIFNLLNEKNILIRTESL